MIGDGDVRTFETEKQKDVTVPRIDQLAVAIIVCTNGTKVSGELAVRPL